MNSNKTKEKLYFDALEKDIYIWFYKNDNFTYLISKEEISKSEKLSKNRKARFCFGLEKCTSWKNKRVCG